MARTYLPHAPAIGGLAKKVHIHQLYTLVKLLSSQREIGSGWAGFENLGEAEDQSEGG